MYNFQNLFLRQGVWMTSSLLTKMFNIFSPKLGFEQLSLFPFLSMSRIFDDIGEDHHPPHHWILMTFVVTIAYFNHCYCRVTTYLTLPFMSSLFERIVWQVGNYIPHYEAYLSCSNYPFSFPIIYVFFSNTLIMINSSLCRGRLTLVFYISLFLRCTSSSGLLFL